MNNRPPRRPTTNKKQLRIRKDVLKALKPSDASKVIGGGSFSGCRVTGM